jgi:hypothetical protein
MFRMLDEPFRLIILIIILGCAFLAKKSHAVPLDPLTTFCTANPTECRKGSVSLLTARGSGTNTYYTLEVDPATGSLPVSPVSPAVTYADSVRNDYSSVNVLTSAWVQLIASTAAEIDLLTVFDSCGQTLELGTGAAASESRQLIIPPGGVDGQFQLRIPAGTRVSVRAVSANCTSGEINITGYNA